MFAKRSLKETEARMVLLQESSDDTKRRMESQDGQ
jgi:hypothetical protein